MKVEANGINYFVKIQQNHQAKPCLILLHGFMGSGRVFDDLIQRVKPFCKPIAIDLLGHGKTGKATSVERFSVKNQVDDLAEIIHKIGGPPSFLYGYSMGGRLALQCAAVKPKLLKGVILESTNPGLASKKERTERKRLDEERALAIEKDFSAFLERWKNLDLFKNPVADEQSLNKYQHVQRSQNSGQMAMSLRGFGTGQMPFVNFSELNLPSLLIAGANDKKYVDIAANMSDQNQRSKLRIIPNAGHRVHTDQPDDVANLLKKFLNRF